MGKRIKSNESNESNKRDESYEGKGRDEWDEWDEMGCGGMWRDVEGLANEGDGDGGCDILAVVWQCRGNGREMGDYGGWWVGVMG